MIYREFREVLYFGQKIFLNDKRRKQGPDWMPVQSRRDPDSKRRGKRRYDAIDRLERYERK